MNSRQTINLFFQGKKLAIAGVSHNPKKFGYILYQTTKDKGFQVVPVNPKGGVIGDVTCVESVSKLGNEIQHLLIVTHKRDTLGVLEEAINRGIKNIWIQQGSETKEVLALAQQKDINLVYKACFLMYANPGGIHKFHQTLARWFGTYAKEIPAGN